MDDTAKIYNFLEEKEKRQAIKLMVKFRQSYPTISTFWKTASASIKFRIWDDTKDDS